MWIKTKKSTKRTYAIVHTNMDTRGGSNIGHSVGQCPANLWAMAHVTCHNLQFWLNNRDDFHTRVGQERYHSMEQLPTKWRHIRMRVRVYHDPSMHHDEPKNTLWVMHSWMSYCLMYFTIVDFRNFCKQYV